MNPPRERCATCGGMAIVGTTCPKSIACPRCGAGPGSVCKRPSGHEAMTVHHARIILAEGTPSPNREER